MINIEVLYPEVANLYGDAFNPQVLYRSYPDSMNIIETHLNEKPAFARKNILNYLRIQAELWINTIRRITG